MPCVCHHYGVMEGNLPIQSVERVKPGAIDKDGTPLDPSLPKDYESRFTARCADPTFVNTVFAHVANGGTLISLAEAWGVRHSDIAGFIADNPAVKERYEFALQARDEWEKERCLAELRAIMAVDIRDAYNQDGTLKPMREMPPNVAAALQSIETDELFEGHGESREMVGYTRKVKFWDKAKAIELFMKKHGLLVERKEVKITNTLEEILSASRAPQIVDAQIVPDENQKGGPTPPGGAGENSSARASA